jgi:L-aspartate oxidase
MGGIVSAVDGKTTLPGLYAVGECASTGLHGANRLASNSLLEAAVCGDLAGKAARDESAASTADILAAEAPPPLPAQALIALRAAMSRDAGVMRDEEGLTRLIGLIADLETQHGRALPLVTARLVAFGALCRRESRGAQYRSDYPCMASPARHTRLTLADAVAGHTESAAKETVA